MTTEPTISERLLSPEIAPTTRQVREVWRFRELVYFLVWKELKVRYKQTVIGAAWAVIQPLSMMIVFSLFFGRLAKIPSNGVPYPLFYFAALVPWLYFSAAINGATNTLVTNQNLVQKVYFPRLLLPLSSVIAPLADLGIASGLLIAISAYYGGVTPALAWVPLFTVALIVTAFTAGVWASALNAVYRDLRYAVPVLLQLWMFVSPVVYPASLVPERWRTLYRLNPLATIIEGFRFCFTGTQPPPLGPLAISLGIVLVFLGFGLRRFWRTESTLADVV